MGRMKNGQTNLTKSKANRGHSLWDSGKKPDEADDDPRPFGFAVDCLMLGADFYDRRKYAQMDTGCFAMESVFVSYKQVIKLFHRLFCENPYIAHAHSGKIGL